MNDLEDIKNEISKKAIHEPIASGNLPHEIIDLEKMIEETPKIAPLFVKIDKYKDILDSVQKLKLSLKNIQFLLAFKEQIKRIDTENDELLHKSLHNLNQLIGQFSTNFTIPRSMNYVPKPMAEPRVDESVSDLGEKITKLREELDKIRV